MARYLKNRLTSEVRAFTDSVEDDQKFRDTILERDDERRPVWEQTGEHDPAVTQVKVTGDVPSAAPLVDAPQPTPAEVQEIVDQRYGDAEPSAEATAPVKKTEKDAA